MKWPVVTMRVEVEEDVVAVRQRAKMIAASLQFSTQDQTRIATALSEIARNAYGYAGGGKVEFGVDVRQGEQFFMIRISDRGPGITDLRSILDGRYVSQTGLGLGITGARRLLDVFEIASERGSGTLVTLGKSLPEGAILFDAKVVRALTKIIAATGLADPNAMMREQNRDLLQSLAALAEREEESKRLNRELEETNRGVVALFAELESKANQLRLAGETLESTVATRTAELANSNMLLKTEAEARERLSEDLRQAQKMEAVGQLTGGIAHDFNNLLTGIIGSLEMLRRRVKQNKLEKLDHYIDIALTSADRAAALTHRLLAFARRQPLDPRPTEVNALVAGMHDLLRRTINEAIELRVQPACVRCMTLCDPYQLENAILNLAINARDAMPDGGCLTIATCLVDRYHHDPSASPAAHVCVSVSDTGTGMPPDVVARAFDPFFTTKPLGQGTGLGLSMIYGFARQSGGGAVIDSVMGKGTAIKIYLPTFIGEVDMHLDAAPLESQSGNGEVILVVEDEAVVRGLVVEALREAGYVVREAVDGPTGLHQLTLPDPVDLVISDVGLPGLNGRQMANAARVAQPSLKILFTTGYAETAMASDGFLESGMAIITKPFAIEALLMKVRDVLDDRDQQARFRHPSA